MYTTYLHPLLSKNEADIDAAIIAAQTNALAFVQSQVKKITDTLWSLMTGTPVTGQQGTGAPAGSEQPSGQAQDPFAFAKNMWNMYGPSMVGSLQKYAQSNAAAASSTASGVERPHLSPSASSQSSTAAPSFPEPQHY